MGEIISIHAPTRGATSYKDFKHNLTEFQSTPLHEGRLVRGKTLGLDYISIHAPTRGATL